MATHLLPQRLSTDTYPGCGFCDDSVVPLERAHEESTLSILEMLVERPFTGPCAREPRRVAARADGTLEQKRREVAEPAKRARLHLLR
jgi:hypothetical protein